MPAGRPREWNRAELREKFFEFVASEKIPIVAKFAYEHGVSRDQLYAWPELTDALKACIAKKESALEELALSGDVNCTMAIFSLKQLGWSDRQDITHKGDAAHPLAITNADGKL
jgi:hypothetical protein